MPVPLLAGLILGGLGLSAGRTVFANKRRGRQADAFDETLSNAARLDPGQRKLIRGVFSLDQSEGIDLLDQTLSRNLQREQLAQAAAFQSENVADRRENLALRQREANQKRRELDQATDPKVTAAAAARKGLRVIGTPEQIASGNFEVAPIKGSAEWNTDLAGFRSISNSLDNANALLASLKKHGAIVDLNNPHGQEQAFHYQLMIAGMKSVLETGALAEFEAAMVGRAIADPGSFFNALMGGGDDRAIVGTGQFRDLVAKSGARASRDRKNHQFDQEDSDAMALGLVTAATLRPVIALPEAAGGPVLPQGAIRVSPGGSGAGQAVGELALQAQILNANLAGDVQKSADLMTRLTQLRRQGEEVGAGRAPIPGGTGALVEGAGQTIFDLIRAF